jgi:hypothetical protein
MLDVEHERLRESERKRLDRIAKDRYQMSITPEERTNSERYQQEEYLRQRTKNAIARLDLRASGEGTTSHSV